MYGWKVGVGEVESDRNRLEKEEDAVKVTNGEEPRAEGVGEGPRCGQKFRPRTRCRNRRFAWPWD